jgi:hypothetical protein
VLHRHRPALVPRAVGLEHVDDHEVAAPLERHARQVGQELLVVELLEPLLVREDLGLELLLRQRRLAPLAVEVDLRIERPRQEADGAQVARRARHEHRVAPAAEDEQSAEPERQLLAHGDQRLAVRPQVRLDERIGLRVLARRDRLIVDQEQAPLAAPPERHRRRQLHLRARIEAVDVEQLLALEGGLAAEAIDQRLLIDRRGRLEHQIGDEAVELECHGRVPCPIDSRFAGARATRAPAIRRPG